MLAAALSALLLTAAPAATANAPQTAVDQVASIIVDRCVPAQRTLDLELNDLGQSWWQLGPNALKQFRYDPDELVLAFQASDGLVLFTPRRSCAVTVVNAGGRVFVDAVASRLKLHGLTVESVDDKAHPSGTGYRLNTMLVPVGGNRRAAVISSYSGDDAPQSAKGIYVSVIAVEKPK